jgi:hypothetical protein
LWEEIDMADEPLLSTPHEKIKIFAGSGLLPQGLSFHLNRLRVCCEQRNAKALVAELKLLVSEYALSKDVYERTLTDSLVKLGLALQFSTDGELTVGSGRSQHLRAEVKLFEAPRNWLPINARKTGSVSGAPPEYQQDLLSVWRRAAEPFAL